jgi:hydrogenase maturation protein HypF
LSAAVVASRIRVTGIVQGVGFRPFVWRLAQDLQLGGWVRNDAQGVEIVAQGAASALVELLARLRSEAPVLSRVDQVTAQDTEAEAFTDFAILASLPGQARTAIGPDVGTCPECLAEMLDPTDRRWRHAFITCTHCGPRYTVTRSLPYDRPQTSLAPFPLCPACQREYTDPADRRYHAETTCCPACGPRLSLCDAQGQSVAGDPIAATLALLRAGAIVAIKGLGGFHLACDARNAQAVARLRLRKNREAKPFALMLANVASLLPLMHVDATEQTLLKGRERPIVLLRTRSGADSDFPCVAPGLLELGVMLPCTPIQHLLFHEAAGRPDGTVGLDAAQPLALVMTSANPGGEPIVRDGAEACARLAGIADAFLDHDRAVVARCDDSVLRAQGQGFQFIRRSRGYAPAAVRLPKSGASVLAFGSHLKNAVCLTRGDQAFLSPYVGDLDNAATCDFLDETVQRMLHLFDVAPEVVAHDLHPDDYSTRAALEFAQRHGLPTVAVQHHHAHIAAVCAEHGHTGSVLGLALDGVGLGSDGAAWGGELLQVHGASCKRLGHLRPLPLPGGDRAAREPWRMAAAVLHVAGRGAEIEKRFGLESRAIAAMLAKNLNCPPSSSMGRVFDAAAGLLGLCTHMQYEAQAAMLLEQAASRHIDLHGWPEPLAQGWTIDGQNRLDLLPLLAYLDGAADVDHAAAVFHATLVAALSDWVDQAGRTTGVKTLIWGGGCWLNSLLSSGMRPNMEQSGLTLLAPVRSPPGDGAIALGQAWVAMNQLEP